MDVTLKPLDWGIIAGYMVFAVVLGMFFTRKASRGIDSFFVGDRKLPWWIAGTSIVATTFAADTPLAITGIVALGGIAGNWIWWSWGIAHLTATFFFARMWRRSGVITDAEITEVRYSGRAAAALRGFKAVYFGIFINCLTMAWVIAAMVKISRAFFVVDPVWVIVGCVVVSVTYTTLGGFRSVVVTDLVQFGLGMAGSIALAVFVVRHYGGIGARTGLDVSTIGDAGLLSALRDVLATQSRELVDTLAFVPGPDHPTTPLIYFIVLLLFGWWRYAEGNGYIVQRLAACKDEGHAQGASLWFAVAHNALRPWPWILVALAAMILFPDLPDKEMGYPLVMARFLPTGILGLVVASLLAAFMSTIDTHVNWGSSYLVQDVYKRFLRPAAPARHYVTVSRLCIVLLAVLAGLSAMIVNNIAEVWIFLITLGAGLGSVTAARWYWWRVTPHAEFGAMGITTLLAVGFQLFCTATLFGGENPFFVFAVERWIQIPTIALASLAVWIPVSIYGPQNDPEQLEAFVQKVRPPGPGWASVRQSLAASGGSITAEPMGPSVLRFAAGLVIVYGAIFGIGYLVLGPRLLGLGISAVSLACLLWVVRTHEA